jgi:hypothetical protein
MLGWEVGNDRSDNEEKRCKASIARSVKSDLQFHDRIEILPTRRFDSKSFLIEM